MHFKIAPLFYRKKELRLKEKWEGQGKVTAAGTVDGSPPPTHPVKESTTEKNGPYYVFIVVHLLLADNKPTASSVRKTVLSTKLQWGQQ